MSIEAYKEPFEFYKQTCGDGDVLLMSPTRAFIGKGLIAKSNNLEKEDPKNVHFVFKTFNSFLESHDEYDYKRHSSIFNFHTVFFCIEKSTNLKELA
jgi:hypothetical protein